MYKKQELHSDIQVSSQREDSVTMHTATTDLEKEAIYALRFKVFFEELSKPLPGNKKKNEKISDELDEKSILLYAKASSNVIGTLRMTVGTIDTFPEWLSNTFSLNKVKSIINPHQKIGLLTKLAIDPAYRGTTLMYQFLKEILIISYDHDVKYAFGGCNPNLISFYERMGFIRFASKNFTEPGYGLLIPIVLITDYLDHFKIARATALRFVREKNTNNASAEAFIKIFPYTKKIINSRLMQGNNLWDYVNAKFPRNSLEKLCFFPFLTLKERISFLECGAIFLCNTGDLIISRGEKINDLYFVLSGTLATDSKLLHSGTFFGSNLNHSCLQTNNTIAIEESELLIIPRQQFEKFKHSNTAAASMISETLSRLPSIKKQDFYVREESI